MTELSLVVPTFNERDNILPLVEKLERALKEVSWEVIFVDDDSPDHTAEMVRELSATKPYVRCLQRIGRRGLSSAVIEGILSTSPNFVAVMDADMQHDETLLPAMLDALRDDDLDIVVGSRYSNGGIVTTWNQTRASMSRFATKMSRIILKAQLSDPMSGFFMVRRDIFNQVVRRLSGQGFKILLDIFASSPIPLRFRELPYEFRARIHGDSKLDALVTWEYLALILDKLVGRFIPVRLLMFSLVGATGVFVHFASLWLASQSLLWPFIWAQSAATVVAMTSNFVLNNLLTYRDKRLRGLKFFGGLLSFYLVCSLGVVANVGVANFVFEHNYVWWAAGGAGVIVGVVWNYAASSVVTWRK